MVAPRYSGASSFHELRQLQHLEDVNSGNLRWLTLASSSVAMLPAVVPVPGEIPLFWPGSHA